MADYLCQRGELAVANLAEVASEASPAGLLRDEDGMSDDALLIIAASEADANLYYACGFLAPDPFVFVQARGRKLLLMSDLEVDRARAQARVDEVRSYSAYEGKARQRWPEPRTADVVTLLLEEAGVAAVSVPATFALEHADRLRERGVRVVAHAVLVSQ